MDEPMAGVDATSERVIIDLLKALREQGKTVIVVHHDLQTVATYFDYLLLLNVRLIAQGKTREVYTAENLRAAYGGQIALLQTAQIPRDAYQDALLKDPEATFPVTPPDPSTGVKG